MNSMIINLLERMEKITRSANLLVVPVSGGSDSALSYRLLNEVCPKKVVGLYVGNNLREIDWFNSTGRLEVLDLKFDPSDAEPFRWAVFLNYSLKNKGWLVGSRTRTENNLGTYSLASRVATYLPLVKVWKTDVMLMCNELNVPKAITDSSRQADPDCGRPKEMAEIPLELIDEYLKFLEGSIAATTISEEQRQYLKAIIVANKFKQSLPLRH